MAGFGQWAGRISVEFIPHRDQRYDTCGDWQLIEDDFGNGHRLHIRISDTGDVRANFNLFKHELDEALLYLFKRNFSLDAVAAVDKFDMGYIEERGTGEPGYESIAPYYAEHMYASAIEHDTALQIGLDWNRYTDLVNDLDTGDHK